MSGVLLVIMALMRLGRFIEYIPESVTLGFTAGIAVVIATLQVKDFFGLPVETMPEHYWDKLAVLGQQLPALDAMSTLVARSEERRVGKEGRARWMTDHERKRREGK